MSTNEAKPKRAEEVTPQPEANNEFDLKNLRLDQNFVETAGVKRLLTTVPVRKPGKQDYVRVHPHPDYRANVALLELKDDREIYLLTPAMALELPGEFFMATLYVTINRQNVLSLWPVKLPAPDGRQLEWHRSAAQAAERAMTQWVRIQPNMSLGAYEIDVAGVTHSDPVWPEFTLQDLIPIAFRDRLVNRIDHPVVQRLRGLT
jgi:uncharacterized protein YbdZ (MbtH family)